MDMIILSLRLALVGLEWGLAVDQAVLFPSHQQEGRVSCIWCIIVFCNVFRIGFNFDCVDEVGYYINLINNYG